MPEVLIKADDLRPDALSPLWRDFLEHCGDRGIHANVGVMGGWTKDRDGDEPAARAAGSEMLGWLLSQDTLHIWNHGYTHQGDRKRGVSEFKGASVEAQVATIRRTQDRIEELCGVRMNAFGAPFNWTDHHTVLALQEVPEIEYAFYTPYVPGKVCYHHELFVTCEPFLGEVRPGAPRRFDADKAIRASRHFRKIGRSFVLQIHPNRWVDGALEDFSGFIDRLHSEGYTTGTIESFATNDTFARTDSGQSPPVADHPADHPAAASARQRLARKVPRQVRRAVPGAVRRKILGRHASS